MAIRITRNNEGNCITFIGSSNPAYWNACLSAELSDDAGRFHIINDLRSANEPEIQYEFYNVLYTDFADADGNAFADAQEAVDYINANANVIGLDGGVDMTGQAINFRLDQTSTSILSTTGSQWGVNSVKAVLETNNLIAIHSIGEGIPTGSEDVNEKKHYRNIEPANVSINGTLATGGPQDVVNAMNELFTVGAFESVVISDPYSTMIADVAGVLAGYTLEGTTAVDPVGDDIFTNSTTGNYAGLKSTATIDQAGEYFTFDIRGEGQIGFGLVHTQASFDNGVYSGNATYADPTTFAVSNSAHYGYQFSHWFHPTPNGSWTNYGANTGVVYGPGWYNWESQDEWLAGDPVKVKVGIDENGFIAISTLQDNDTDWVLHARSSYPVQQGAEFHLGIKSASSTARVFSAPKVHLLEEEAPTMYFRYIESPDGVYDWPLFATQEEAEYYDKTTQGTETGEAHTHVYVDDPTNATWYMPTNGSFMSSTTDPSTVINLFEGQAVTYTEITSLSNADLTPPAFSSSTLSVNEGESVTYQTQPQDTAYTTTFANLPLGLLDSGGGMIGGNAPEVTGDNVANPSDTYTVTVTRTNSYGSSTGTLSIVVANLTAPVVTPITGITHEGGTAMVDADTMGDGTVVSIDNVVDNGNRVVLDKEWLNNYVLPAITSGSGSKSVWVGFAAQGVTPDYSSVSREDFRVAYEFNCDDSSRASSNWRLKTHAQGASYANVGVGSLTDGLYDFVFMNEGATLRAGALTASAGHDASTKVFDANDGDWNWTVSNSSAVGNQDLLIATVNTTLDLSLTEFNEYTEPTPPATILTPWTKALDFSGSSEYALQVSPSASANAIRMQGLGTTVPANAVSGRTSDSSSARPWATAIVFQADRNSSNQHIWNSGEGAGSTDDNIYTRLDSNGNLYFGWGRQGSVNECRIGGVPHYSTGRYWGVYVAHNGTRLSGNDATAANLAACFDIRIMTNNGNDDFATLGSNLSTTANWTAGTTGGRMDRSVNGTFTIGGRANNRSFHGKVASMVVTHLKLDTAMPTDAEITLMITDPKKWEDDYRVGQSVRQSFGINNATYYPNNLYTGYGNTQIWLMGDGTSDSYANGIRNEVWPSDQNYSKLQLNSMVSNDIQNVTISGLS